MCIRDRYYLESVDEQTLEKGVYDGLVKALGDPYSVYYSAEELKELQDKTEGDVYKRQGKMQELTVVKKVDFGVYLAPEDNREDKVLLLSLIHI